jgi:hypothetical protein
VVGARQVERLLNLVPLERLSLSCAQPERLEAAS